MSAAEPLTGDLIEGGLAERHRELLQQYADGVSAMCVSLWYIREEATFKAEGYKTFGAFLEQRGLSRTTGRLYANVGAVVLALRQTGHEKLVTHPDMLRSIAGILVTQGPKKQSEEVQARIVQKLAQTVRIAAGKARHDMVPLTADVINLVAETNYGIKSPTKYQQERLERRLPSRDLFVRKFNDRAQKVVALGDPEDLVDAYGTAMGWEWFEELYDWMQRAREIS